MVFLCVTYLIRTINNIMSESTKNKQGIAILIMAVLCLFAIDSVGQVKNYNVWLLSSGDIMDFNSGQVVVTEASGSISNRNWLSLSDDEGRLVLYGFCDIYDGEGNKICNIPAYYGGFGIRNPVASDSYYLFVSGVVRDEPSVSNFKMRHIFHVYKEDTSDSFFCDKIGDFNCDGSMVGGANDEEVFFITADWCDDNISVYVVCNNKVKCVQTVLNSCCQTIDENYGLRFNADLSRLYIKSHSDGLFIFDFDLDSKTLGNETFVAMDQLKAFDFSENGEYIYFLQGLRGEYTVSRCRESDLLNYSNIETIATLTGKWGNHSGNWEDLQLAPDGNIYIGIYRWDKLSYISETDGECVFHEDEIKLSNPFGGRFPKMPRYQSSFKISKCSPTVAPEYRGYPYTSISWDFGDGTPVVNDERPVHHYEKSGKYTVTMTAVFKNGIEKVVKKEIDVIGSKPLKIIMEDGF